MARIARKVRHGIWHSLVIYGATIAAGYGYPDALMEALRDD